MTDPQVPSDVVLERCRRLITHLREFPKTFDMQWFMYGHEIDEAHPCGTIGCIAGTLVFLEDGPLSGKMTHDEWNPNVRPGFSAVEISARATELLEIDKESASALFFVSRWPAHLGNFHMDEEGYSHPADFTAEDGIARIEYFMKTGI